MCGICRAKNLLICRGHEDLVTSVCVRTDGKIVSGSKDKTVRVWDMHGNELAVCRGHEDRVSSVYVTNDGKIVSGSVDDTICVWDMRGNQLAVCRGHENSVYSVCITKDGKIVSGAYDKTVRVWNIGLLDRIVGMDEDQARALWELLHNFLKEYRDRQTRAVERDREGSWRRCSSGTCHYQQQ